MKKYILFFLLFAILLLPSCAEDKQTFTPEELSEVRYIIETSPGYDLECVGDNVEAVRLYMQPMTLDSLLAKRTEVAEPGIPQKAILIDGNELFPDSNDEHMYIAFVFEKEDGQFPIHNCVYASIDNGIINLKFKKTPREDNREYEHMITYPLTILKVVRSDITSEIKEILLEVVEEE